MYELEQMTLEVSAGNCWEVQQQMNMADQQQLENIQQMLSANTFLGNTLGEMASKSGAALPYVAS